MLLSVFGRAILGKTDYGIMCLLYKADKIAKLTTKWIQEYLKEGVCKPLTSIDEDSPVGTDSNYLRISLRLSLLTVEQVES
ncbi:General transcription and DNA repair factor IIH helicase subunit XPD [Desmophyllum pertusum]|uniref:General transcription and DNA repair factor IIH helicase subunit XPD n=1 Tax=Desmophyllum pertusum TaxID=174260 RepID=A0A9W9YPN6_9CNID|nr:General transcription and DNA repair factor IIH helicase subunit XPD [Desmophyllum pertusum]